MYIWVFAPRAFHFICWEPTIFNHSIHHLPSNRTWLAVKSTSNSLLIFPARHLHLWWISRDFSMYTFSIYFPCFPIIHWLSIICQWVFSPLESSQLPSRATWLTDSIPWEWRCRFSEHVKIHFWWYLISDVGKPSFLMAQKSWVFIFVFGQDLFHRETHCKEWLGEVFTLNKSIIIGGMIGINHYADFLPFWSSDGPNLSEKILGGRSSKNDHRPMGPMVL